MDPAVHLILRRKQRRLVRENPGVLVAVAKGANQAIQECQFQFRNRRWNCSTKNFLRGKNLFGKIVDRGKCMLWNKKNPGVSFSILLWIVFKYFV
jgi:wingless-type MMTV integration site family protein 1